MTLLFLALGVETLEQPRLIMEHADVQWHVLGKEDSDLHQRQRTRIEAVPAPSTCFNLLQVVDMTQRLKPKKHVPRSLAFMRHKV